MMPATDQISSDNSHITTSQAAAVRSSNGMPEGQFTAVLYQVR